MASHSYLSRDTLYLAAAILIVPASCIFVSRSGNLRYLLMLALPALWISSCSAFFSNFDSAVLGNLNRDTASMGQQVRSSKSATVATNLLRDFVVIQVEKSTLRIEGSSQQGL